MPVWAKMTINQEFGCYYPLTMSILIQDYLSADAVGLPELLTQPGVLAVVGFIESCAPSSFPGYLPVGMPTLSGKSLEIIRYGNVPAQRGITGDCHWSLIDDVLCASIWISPHDCQDIESATEKAYESLFRLIQSMGFPYPFRIWNFIPNINLGDGDREEYKKFCVGRQRAFHSCHVAPQEYPAASALGHHGKGAVIYLLAGRDSGMHHENPRQQPAYQYPRQYGPSSPSFARATSLSLASQLQIFISGTASIVGHDTKAVGDLQEQLNITLANIQELVTHVDQQQYALSAIRVYLRHPHHYEIAKSFLEQYFSLDKINFLHADICREQLLVEIEALASPADDL
jgi:chorismate lyase / 3-hydroxybenzoate synthase